jgi:uncharacterized protein YggE
MKTLFVLLTVLAAWPVHAEQTISVTGDAEIKVVPDQVVMFLGVEVHSKTLDEARRENDRRVSSVRAAVVKLGVQEGDIQTDFIQLGMAYEPDGITPKFYYTRKSIVLVSRNIQRMEQTLSAAVNAGATHIHGVEFETTKLREYRDQARAIAVKAATEKARDMSAAAGMKVLGGPTGISSAQYGGRSWYGSGWGMGSNGMMSQNVDVNGGSAPGTAESSVALGRISVTATVSVEFRMQ